MYRKALKNLKEKTLFKFHFLIHDVLVSLKMLREKAERKTFHRVINNPQVSVSASNIHNLWQRATRLLIKQPAAMGKQKNILQALLFFFFLMGRTDPYGLWGFANHKQTVLSYSG
jgi:hypothetical protein